MYGQNPNSSVGEIIDDHNDNDNQKPYDTMTPARATEYRSVTARANFLAADRGDIIYTVKECARCMSEPTERDWGKLVRLGRYLKGRPRLVVWYEYQDEQTQVHVYSDTDWAGCRKTR